MEAHRLGPGKVVVLLDSNTLILMASGAIAPSMILEAINSRFTPATTSAVVAELERLAGAHGKRLLGRRAQTALRLLRQMGVEVLETESRDATTASRRPPRGSRRWEPGFTSPPATGA
ncbi:PIN domain-containing protein [Aeropyrum camini]|uniref:PIN domain-containing protein n=1 Tax=Aeropyrum camini TaxID=229980 RepID=UPI000786A1AE|nr:PIN domain-containing protein [Aeropyrum camini]